MALGVSTVFEVRGTNGNDANGGGFNSSGSSPGTDRSQSGTPHVTIDGATITATVHSTTTQMNISGYTVSSADIRNICNLSINGGALTLFEITAVDTTNNRWTMDRTLGSVGQAITGRMGGAWLTLTPVGALNGASHATTGTIYITQEGGSNFTHGALVSLGNGRRLIGYGSSRGDNGTVQIDATSISLSITGAHTIRNIIVDTSGFASNRTLIDSIVAFADNCQALNNNTAGSGSGFRCQVSTAMVSNCYASACGTGFVDGIGSNTGGNFSQCYADGCANGFGIGLGGDLTDCLATDCTTRGYSISGYARLRKCTSYNCGIGFELTAASGIAFFDYCLAYDNTTYGFSVNTNVTYMRNCAAGASGTANTNGTPIENTGFITLTADPFTDSASGDFSLNNTTGGGALLRNISFQFLELSTTTSYPSVGATEPNDHGIVLPSSGQLWPLGGLVQ